MQKAQSVLSRLQNKAKETGRSYQLCLQLFCQEEFLRRLSLSKYVDNLILKGGLFIYTLTKFESRATVDVDFLLRYRSNSKQEIIKIVNAIIAQATGNNFITFELNGVSDIALPKKYTGISVKLTARIAHTRTPFKIDFGIGDALVPKPQKRTIPTQLDTFIKPEINTYSLESTIAEKFDAMLQRLAFTSRMKDYFDIAYLANTFEFDGRRLQEAIFETLQNRGTRYEKNSFEEIASFANHEEMNLKWRHFLRKLKLTEPPFSDVLKIIESFLSPVFDAIVSERDFYGKWDRQTFLWRNN
jgi:predicted nucleotidyltransferase component of viral defense system